MQKRLKLILIKNNIKENININEHFLLNLKNFTIILYLNLRMNLFLLNRFKEQFIIF